MYKKILIIADIEGSTGCWSYEASSFKTEAWANACLDMTLDIKSVTEALFEAGAESVKVKDFHRTGYNIFPEMLDKRVSLVSGYRHGPVPGLGHPGDAQALMMIGLHAASGTDGFLAHTLTSRIALLEVNGRPVTEAELFASSVSHFNIDPIFFSGCALACSQARSAMPDLSVFTVDKSGREKDYHREEQRGQLARAAAESLKNENSCPFEMKGPFNVKIRLRDGHRAAEKISGRWGFDSDADTVFFKADTFMDLYFSLIRICYLTPFVEKILYPGLALYNMWGKAGLNWARKKQ